MEFQKSGLANGPIILCIPGLVGGPEDFKGMMPGLNERFTVLIFDPNSERRTSEGLNLTVDTLKEVSYLSTADIIKDLLIKNFPDQGYYFLGVSLGGKVVYDFAFKYPDLFKGGVVTDVGPGSFTDSDLFKTIQNIVDNLDVNQEWSELKKELIAKVPDKNLRIILQSQISYPEKKLPAVWKTGIRSIETIIKEQVTDDQKDSLGQMDSQMAENQKYFHVLHSGKTSGISKESFDKMKLMKSVKIIEVPDASHFLHVTHKDLIVDTAVSMIN